MEHCTHLYWPLRAMVVTDLIESSAPQIIKLPGTKYAAYLCVKGVKVAVKVKLVRFKDSFIRIFGLSNQNLVDYSYC